MALYARENRDVPADYQGYVADRPIALWLDQEAFSWHGVPESLEDLGCNSPEGENKDGVVDYQIEYVRVWQKPSQMAQ